ncbi:MAG: VOC family protein [Pseudomonadota bacterium]
MLSSSPLDVFVPVADGDRARTFYGDVLGLDLVEETPFALVYDAPGGRLRLAKTPSFVPQPFTVAGWAIADIDVAMAQLEKGGVTFERFASLPQDDRGIWTTSDGAKICWFKDPDGNLLSLAQQPT